MCHILAKFTPGDILAVRVPSIFIKGDIFTARLPHFFHCDRSKQ
ncbi:hypothetical protein UYSO10_3305 [Kosakonia radicincitans]|nr:hypothetical protein UYSO10_3305 [Kosakonia radicincitans]